MFGKDFLIFERALDLLMERHEIISSNIANVDTPHYKAKDLDFSEYLKYFWEGEKVKGIELLRTHKVHLTRSSPPPPRPQVFYVMSSFGNDENSVDIDEEMTKLTQNTFSFRAISQFLSEKMRGIIDTIERTRP